MLNDITSAFNTTWRHVNLHGTYDFSNLMTENDNVYLLDEVISFKVA